MRGKILAILFTFAVCTAAAWPQHGQPGSRPNIPGGGSGAGHTPSGTTPSPSVYDSATAVWTFNDPTDLGAAVPDTYDLTLVNTPTATGGALGYAANFVTASTQYAYIADNSTFNNGTDDILMCVWVRPGAVTTQMLMSQDKVSNRDYFLYLESSNSRYAMLSFSNTGDYQTALAAANSAVSGKRSFICGGVDISEKKSLVSVDAAAAVFSTAWATGTTLNNSSAYFGVAAREYVGSQAALTGALSSAMFWKGSGLDFSTIITAAYNSGKGYTCSAATTAGLNTNGVSCWDLTENGGPYVDSWGSNTLTGVNTPTRAAGLVERSDSGMSMNVVSASSQQGNVAVPVGQSDNQNSFTVSTWVNHSGAAVGQGILSIGNAVTDSTPYFLLARTVTTDDIKAFWGNAYTTAHNSVANTWYHVVFTWNKDTSSWQFLVDNTSIATGTTNDIYFDASNKLYMGTGYAAAYSGAIDNVALWTSVLSEDDISSLYNSGAGLFYTAYWDAYFSGDPIRFAWSAMPEIRRID